MKVKILWIEGKRADSPSFVPALRKKDFNVEIVATGSAALERLQEVDPDLVVVNECDAPRHSVPRQQRCPGPATRRRGIITGSRQSSLLV